MQEAELSELYEAFQKSIGVSSNVLDASRTPEGKAFIAQGDEAARFLFKTQAHLGPFDMYVLHLITGACPVPKEHAGFIELMSEDYRAWARTNGYEVAPRD